MRSDQSNVAEVLGCIVNLGNTKPLNVTVVEELQNSVTLRMSRMAWNDPRQILPAIISYGRRWALFSLDLFSLPSQLKSYLLLFALVKTAFGIRISMIIPSVTARKP